MNYRFFEQLTEAEAQAYLAAFLVEERNEAFQRGFASLSWAVGRVERAEEGQPVLTGVQQRPGLPAGTAVDYWRRLV